MTKIICFLNCLAHWPKSFCHHLMFGVCELLTFQSSPETGWPIGTTFAEIMFRRSFTKVIISFWLDSKHGRHWYSCFWMTSMQKKSSHLILLCPLERNFAEMMFGWSSTKILHFIMNRKALKTYDKLQSNFAGMIFGKSFTKSLFFFFSFFSMGQKPWPSQAIMLSNCNFFSV